MKKKIIVLLLVLLFGIIGFLYLNEDINGYLKGKMGLIVDKGKQITLENKKEIENKDNNGKVDEEQIKDKIEVIRNKMKVKGLIESGNSFLENQYYLYALKEYLKASSESPKDKSIVNKIAITYFSMKNFTRSYGYYRQISDYEKLNKDDAMLSLIYSKEITKENKKYFFDEIDYFKLGEEKTFYYKTSINCIEDFHRCKQIFADYIAQKEKLGLKIETKEMLNIKDAFSNYDNFKVEDLTYKNALLVGVFLQNKLYPVSISLGKQLLKEKPDYRAIFQIIGKSYFELGKYKEAKNYLSDYLELDVENKDVIYLLGIINSELGEYALSNIYLKTALEKGYKPSINLRRRMVYNLGELGENKKMMEYFKELISKESKLERSDLYLYVYYSIVNQNLQEAEELSKMGMKMFPDDSNFYGYLGWINKENSNIEKAEKFLLQGLELDSKSAMINLNLGLIEFERQDYSKALIYFKKTVSYDKTGDFSPLAEDGLNKIEEEMKKSEEEKYQN